MLSRFWGVQTLFAGILMLFALAVASTQQQDKNSYESNGRNAAPQRHDRNARKDVVKPGQADPANVQANRDEWYQQQDLKAQESMALYALIACVISSLGAGITGLGVYYVKRTLEANKDMLYASVGMLEEARKTTELNQKQFIAAQRPWLRIEPIISGPLHHKDDGRISIRILFVVRNIGNYPAKDIWMDNKTILTGIVEGGFDPFYELANVINRAVSFPNTDIGNFLFPEESFKKLYTFEFSKVDVVKATKHREYITPYIMSCVRYRFDTSSATHYTAIARELCRTNRPRPEVIARNRAINVIFIDDGNIAMEDLAFSPNHMPVDRAT